MVLALLAEQPRHGYELIKELEDRTGGAYRPSPGVIYPLLALLEDEGFIRPVEAEGGRKLYEATDAGREALEKNRAGVDAVFGRMAEAARGADTTRPRIGRAMANLGMALQPAPVAAARSRPRRSTASSPCSTTPPRRSRRAEEGPRCDPARPIVTGNARRYMSQLCKHFAHRSRRPGRA